MKRDFRYIDRRRIHVNGLLVVAIWSFSSCDDCEREPYETCVDLEGENLSMSASDGSWRALEELRSEPSLNSPYHPGGIGANVFVQLDLGDTLARCVERNHSINSCQRANMYLYWAHKPMDGDYVEFSGLEDQHDDKVNGTIHLYSLNFLGSGTDYFRDDHYLLSSGSITVDDVYPKENRVSFSAVFVPNPYFEPILREHNLYVDQVRFEGTAACVPRTDYPCRYP